MTSKTELRCPDCGGSEIRAENKAFISQPIQLRDDGTLEYDPWTTEDVSFDGPEWYVCRVCGEDWDDLERFKVTTEVET